MHWVDLMLGDMLAVRLSDVLVIWVVVRRSAGFALMEERPGSEEELGLARAAHFEVVDALLVMVEVEEEDRLSEGHDDC